MEAPLLVKSILAGLAIAAPVGPVGVLCVQRAVTISRLSGLISGLGAALADVLYGAVAAFGITLIARFIEDHLAILQASGGVLLILLAWRGWTRGHARPAHERPGASHHGLNGLAEDFLSTFVLTMVNPITLFAFAGIFIALGIRPDPLSPGDPFVIMAGVFVGSALWWVGIALGGHRLGHRLSERMLTRIARGSALMLAGFAVYALVAGLRGL